MSRERVAITVVGGSDDIDSRFPVSARKVDRVTGKDVVGTAVVGEPVKIIIFNVTHNML